MRYIYDDICALPITNLLSVNNQSTTVHCSIIPVAIMTNNMCS